MAKYWFLLNPKDTIKRLKRQEQENIACNI